VKQKLLLFLIIFLTKEAYTEVLKIIVYDCESKKQYIVGSGFGFTEEAIQSSFILTSDHIAVDRKNLCYKAELDKNTYDLTLIDNDWSMGQALLKINTKANFKSTVNHLYEHKLETSDNRTRSLTSLGFPKNSKNLLEHKNQAQILVTDRHGFSNIEFAYEVIGLRVENGMSGGVVVSDQGYVLGLITQQIIATLPGQASLPTFSESTSTHGIIIPSHYLKKWVQSRLAGEISIYKTQIQGVNKQVVSIGSVVFTETKSDFIQVAGGGDGVGVGSDVSDEKIVNTITFKVNNDFLNSNQFAPWFKTHFKNLKTGNTYRVDSALYFDPEGSELRTIKFQSLSEFLKSLSNKNIIPIITQETGENLNLGQNISKEVSDAFNLLKTNLLDKNQETSLLDSIHSLVHLRSSGVEINLSLNFIEQIEKNPIWSECFDIDLNATVTVLKELKKISSEKRALKTFK
jgi:hypothetical protein